MVEITAKQVNELRTITGAPLMKCKVALIEAGGDPTQAGRILRQKGIAGNSTSGSAGNQGYIAVYSHPGSQIVSLVELACDTDFAMRSAEFRTVASELAMQVAATAPTALSPDDLPNTVRDEELQIARTQTESDPKMSGKSFELREQIARNRAEKNLAERCLLTQNSIRDPQITVGSLLDDLRLKVREGVQVRRFARWRVGESLANA